ncbi:protein HESO1-like [Lotus japonicus]|uniref:protein HESO1-like n=1 Tax=Lotus japonicus TaxID=34305 RepID=UPI002588EEB1|nr:protein HESO1-like [Lotus japonicus]XP_057420567.1 protein HESO1-like [Lotus japonicus]
MSLHAASSPDYQSFPGSMLKQQVTVEFAKQVLQAVVSTKQEKLESEILRKIKFTQTCVSELDGLLCDTYVRMCPKEIDSFNRITLLRIFNLVAEELYGNSHDIPVVEGHGSFVMDMFTNVSDLDLSINFHAKRENSLHEKIKALLRFRDKLDSLEREGSVTCVQSTVVAEVPIIKFTERVTGIECNLSVNNWDGIKKSKIIYAISAIDERFRKLCFLMKSWAKAHYIYSSKDGILNFLSIILFVAFHLQTCNPPILPPFSILLKDGADVMSVTKIVETYRNYGKQNKESLAKLFITLLVKLASVESLWEQGICASVYEGSWILKYWNHHYSMRVEDFMDRSQNVSRAVGTAKVETIYRCIHKSISYLSQFLNNQIQGIQLVDFLFGTHTVASLGVGGTSYISGNHLRSRENLHQWRLMLQYLKKVAQNARASFPPSWQSSQGGVQSLNQEAVAPNPWGRSFPQRKRPDKPPSSTGPLPPREKPCQQPQPSSTGALPPRAIPYQPPVHNGLGAVPSPFTSQPIVSGGLVSSQSSRGGVQSLNQEAVAPIPRGRSFPQRKRPDHPPPSEGPLPPKKRPDHRIMHDGSSHK